MVKLSVKNTGFSLLFVTLFVALAAIFALTATIEAYALGVSTPYIENNILGVTEGKSVMFTITLQNVEKEDMRARVDSSSDGNIASIIDHKDVYVLPAGSLDTKVTFNITAPEKAKIGDVYDFRFTVAPLQTQAGGLISVLPGISRSFKVVITRDSNKFYLNYYLTETGKLWGIVLLVLAGYIAYGIYKRRKSKGRKIF
ncbi:hypothetical protein HYV83_04825 [Candidatus Woesearchaeota archaeon]|nr:hypothetical protein [Candidatus Woesearchaeota archaeon]